MLPFPALPHPSRLAVRALNALLKREDWARERLARHAGKTVRFSVGGFRSSLTIDAQGYADVADPAIVPDVTLTIAPEKLSLARLFQRGASSSKADAARQRADSVADMTHISGDAGLAQVVAELAANLRWDVEDDLARVVGDIPAVRLTQGARAMSAGVRDAAGRLGANVAEYLAQERPVLTGRPALEGWRAGVASTASSADALAARMARLEARLAAWTGRRGEEAPGTGRPTGGA
jgi:ubiquinone biosynthesis protein UbiJ